jgi:hypothetical protein
MKGNRYEALGTTLEDKNPAKALGRRQQATGTRH